MTQTPTAEQIVAQLDAARAWNLHRICLDAEQRAGLPQGLLLAIASRESGCTNVVGDGGHGRGVFQIDDRWHRDWLAEQGVDSADLVPPVAPAAAYAASLLGAALASGRREGVAEGDLPKFVASAYNAGTRGALDGYRSGDSDLRTTGADYGADVLRRLAAVRDWLARNGVAAAPQTEVAAAAHAHGEKPLLHPGDQGPAVRELKLALKAWYDVNPPAPSFTLGALYGPNAVEAVMEFQRRSGLDPDGIVGPKTWAAFGGPAPVLRTLTGRHPRQLPPLPREIGFPDDAYPRPSGWMGLQPWVVPQARAIAEHFGLTVRAGHGGHPPHAPRSDHAWGGAVDLVGPRERMVSCNLWADGLCADPWRRGAVFRWVGGPARDAGGPEAGHLDHVHLSWFRLGPPTTVFGTPEFP